VNFYEKYILPHLLNCTCNQKPFVHQRRKVVPLAKGNILEIGIGSGLNIPFYEAEGIDKIWGIDPSEELIAMAKNQVKDDTPDIEFIISKAEEIDFEDDFFDTILMTYTMCTISNLSEAFTELKRVIKPTGKLIFCEHGMAPDENVIKWQNRINTFWPKISGGCNINKEIPSIIESSGFSISDLENMYLPKTPKVLGFNYWGTATLNS
jgi:ubiquinone/menaquinone biosynthesis C-methylase UbiE